MPETAPRPIVDYEVTVRVSRWLAGYAPEVTAAVLSALERGGFPEGQAEIAGAREIYPDPPLTSARLVTTEVESLSALYLSLPEPFRTAEVLDALSEAYHRELDRLWRSAREPGCVRGAIRLSPWCKAGDQWVCEFMSYDLAEPAARQSGTCLNLHGQDMSRWKNARTGWSGHQGAIVFDERDGRVTCHH